MKLFTLLLALLFAFLANPAFARPEMVIDDKHVADYLYVLSARSGVVEGDQIRLKGIATVTFFSDRPNRVAGHLGLEPFVAQMQKSDYTLPNDPPNATLSILKPDGNENVVIELMDPELKDGVLLLKYRVLDGVLPPTFGPASLFIDAYPTAINGQIT